MVYGLWQSAAGMAANQYHQNVAANNIANINTVGFKHDLAMLVERPVESREDGDARQFAHAMFDMLSGGTHVRPTIQASRDRTIAVLLRHALTNRRARPLARGKLTASESSVNDCTSMA